MTMSFLEELIRDLLISVFVGSRSSQRTSAPVPVDADGRPIVKHTAVHRVVGFMMCGVALTMGWLALFGDGRPRPLSIEAILSIVLGGFALFAFHVGLAMARTRIVLHEDGLSARQAWWPARFLRWGDIREVMWNARWERLEIRDTRGRFVGVSKGVIGLGQLHAELKRRVPTACWSGADVPRDAL